jgi:four helix bundle protein
LNLVLSIAKGSAGETRSQLYRVLDYNYIDVVKFEILKNRNLSGKINNFISYLNKKDFKNQVSVSTGTLNFKL